MGNNNTPIEQLETEAFLVNEHGILDLLKSLSEDIDVKGSQGISKIDMEVIDISKEKIRIHSEFSNHALKFAQEVGDSWVNREASESDTRDTLARALVGLLGVFMLFTGMMICLQGPETMVLNFRILSLLRSSELLRLVL